LLGARDGTGGARVELVEAEDGRGALDNFAPLASFSLLEKIPDMESLEKDLRSFLPTVLGAIEAGGVKVVTELPSGMRLW
jgi:hypothetical protein